MSLRLVTGYPRVDPPTTPGVPAASWVTSTPKNDVQSLSWRTCNRGSTSSWRVTKTYMRPVTGVARISAGTAISNRACATTGNGKRSEEHTSELQSHHDLVCRLLLEKKKKKKNKNNKKKTTQN